MDEAIKNFFSSSAFAVIGASKDHNKYGNKVLRCYLENDIKVYAVNPNEVEIEGINCFSKISELPTEVKSISIVTPPKITEDIVTEAISHGIQHIWMQPGAESEKAIRECKKHNINIIANGPCILQKLEFNG